MKARDYLLGGYFLICAVALTWPVYDRLGNSLEPYVLGLPMSFAWNIGWVLLTFAVLLAYHFTSGGEERR